MRIVSEFLPLAAACGVFLEWEPRGEEVPDKLRSDTQGRSWVSRSFSPEPVMSMSSLSLPGNVKDHHNEGLYPIYLVLGGVGILAFLGVGMVAARKRRHEHGRLWLPEGFKTTETNKKKRREPVGEDSVGLK